MASRAAHEFQTKLTQLAHSSRRSWAEVVPSTDDLIFPVSSNGRSLWTGIPRLASLEDTAATWKLRYLCKDTAARDSPPRNKEHDSAPHQRASRLQDRAPWLRQRERSNQARPLMHQAHSAWKRAVLDPASHTSSLDRHLLQENLRTLSRFVPSFSYSQRQLSPAMLVRMAGEMEAVFQRLLAFRLTFPDSNITSMLATRPELLMREAFVGVAPALQKLRALFPGAEIERVVERQPYFLLANCDQLIQEMQGSGLLPADLGRGRAAAANRAERILINVQTSSIQSTASYKQLRKQMVEAGTQPRPWVDAELYPA